MKRQIVSLNNWQQFCGQKEKEIIYNENLLYG